MVKTSNSSSEDRISNPWTGKHCPESDATALEDLCWWLPKLHDPAMERLHNKLKRIDLGTRELPLSMRVCMRADGRSGSGHHTDMLWSISGMSGNGTKRDLVRFRSSSHSASISATLARNWLITTAGSSGPFGMVTSLLVGHLLADPCQPCNPCVQSFLFGDAFFLQTGCSGNA